MRIHGQVYFWVEPPFVRLMASLPPAAPAAWGCTLQWLASMMSHSKSGSTMRASSISSQTPRSRHRQKRRCVFFQSPRSGGKSRHGAPVLSIQKTALINNRLSAEGRPTEPLEPGRSFSIFAHTLSEISCLRCAAIWSLLIVSEEIITYFWIWRHYLEWT